MVLSRRSFLRASAAAAATIGFPAIVRAAPPWAELPASVGDLPKYKILEIHLPGGASVWESLWVSHDGPGGQLNWRGLGEYVANLQWQVCANGPASALDTREFDVDANGTPVSWGPATAPLWRADIMDRCRMIVTQHADGLHGAASHRVMTGRRLGSPRAAGLGAAIQRHFQSTGEQLEIPYSYVFGPKGNGGRTYFMQYPAAIGRHPSHSRPLVLTIGQAIGDLLVRDAIPEPADAVFDALRAQYRDLLRWPESGAPVRAVDFESYDASAHYVTHAGALDAHLGGSELDAQASQACANDPAHGFAPMTNATQRSLQLAARMFDSGARHVTVIDGGLQDADELLLNGDMPYDAHNNAPGKSRNIVESNSVHLFNLFQSLAAVIAPPPGDVGSIAMAPSGPMIDLAETLIVVNTDFNRTPNPGIGINEEGYAYAGREHFQSGNVSLLIGGPVSARGIQGGFALSANDAYETAIATGALTPTDVHAGVLLAAGVDPIDPDNLIVEDDFSGIVNPGGNAYASEIRTKLKQHVLGISGQINSVTLGA